MKGRSPPHSFSRLVPALVLLSLMLVVGVAPVSASHAWANYHWGRTANPFTLKLESDLTTAAWQGYLGNVSSDWSASTVLDTAIVNQLDPKGNCRAIIGQDRVCNKKYGFNGWLGLAQIWVSGDHIVAGVAKVNDTYFNTKTYNSPSAKRHVLCQEVGHTLGLGHQTAVSCMDDRNGLFDPAYVSPNDHDYEQLSTIYTHTDSSSTVAAVAASELNSDAGEGPNFGVPVGKSGDRETLFVRDMGGGRKLFTWVFWAAPGAASAR